MMADQMLALARGIGTAADRHAEPREEQDLDQAAQSGAVALEECGGIRDQLVLEIGDEGEWD